MVQRTQRTSGRVFYGCSTYPRCKGTQPYRDVPAQAPLPGMDRELFHLRATLAWTRRELAEVTATLQRLQQAPPATSRERQALVKALTHLLSLVHPDKWQDHPCALEVTKQLVTLRTRLQEGRL